MARKNWNIFSLSLRCIAVFPAVTICNQNLYRKSIVEKEPHLLDTLKMIYDPRRRNKSTITLDPRIDKINLTSLMLQNAQPLSEMLVFCKFRGQDKNCSEIFELILTSFGWCYIFNSFGSILKTGGFRTYGTGSAQGLFLRMNVNQDEYMFGPSLSAGFKVCARIRSRVFGLGGPEPK